MHTNSDCGALLNIQVSLSQRSVKIAPIVGRFSRLFEIVSKRPCKFVSSLLFNLCESLFHSTSHKNLKGLFLLSTTQHVNVCSGTDKYMQLLPALRVTKFSKYVFTETGFMYAVRMCVHE